MAGQMRIKITLLNLLLRAAGVGYFDEPSLL